MPREDLAVVDSHSYLSKRLASVELTFHSVQLSSVRDYLRQYFAGLPSAIDSFLEDHLFESSFYAIHMLGEPAGLTAIHRDRLVTHFSLSPAHKRYGQPIFAEVKRLAEVQAAFVPTCDEFFLAHVLDSYRQMALQAYFFAAPAELPTPGSSAGDVGYRLRLATADDTDRIVEGSGDFFGTRGAIQQQLADRKLYVTLADDAWVGFGIMEKSRLLDDVASIGMFVLENQRRQGFGTTIIRLLINSCREQGLRPIAGCWYYNHASKKTLERAGLYTQTRLLKVDF